MIGRVCLAAGLAAVIGAEDRVLLRSGDWLDGTLLEADSRAVRMLVTGLPVTLARARVEAVLPGAGERPPPPPPAPEPPREPSGWSIDLGLAAGWGWGSLDGTGRLRHLATGTSTRLETTIDLQGIGAMPGGSLRGCWSPPAGGILCGVQVGAGRMEAGEATTEVRRIEALVGWTGGGALRWHAALLAGWSQARMERHLALGDMSGGAVTTIDDQADLAGPVATAETGLTWEGGGWRRGLVVGMQVHRWSGSSSWTSGDGAYRGDEDLSGRLTGLYAGLTCGWGW
jgi:hypothetical protein